MFTLAVFGVIQRIFSQMQCCTFAKLAYQGPSNHLEPQVSDAQPGYVHPVLYLRTDAVLYSAGVGTPKGVISHTPRCPSNSYQQTKLTAGPGQDNVVFVLLPILLAPSNASTHHERPVLLSCVALRKLYCQERHFPLLAQASDAWCSPCVILTNPPQGHPYHQDFRPACRSLGALWLVHGVWTARV